MTGKKRTTSVLFAVLAGCTVLALAAFPALAGPANDKGQGQDKKDEQAASQAENAGSGGSAASSKSGGGKGQAKKSGSGSTGSQSSGPSESSANTPAPEGSTTGKPAQGCDQKDAGYTHNYASTCDGSPSPNGNGDGKATGKPCAGCVGAADNKNPKGQFPDGSDDNKGYECDDNKGIGVGNPAHTSCEPSTFTPEPPQEVIPEVIPEEVLPEVVVPEEVRTDESQPDAVAGTVIDKAERAPRVLGAVLPFTGVPILSLVGLALSFMGAGTLVSRIGRRP